ncbi:hypothetical protein POM88_033602 [Heracleum sosnowskyi]|uniref:F-box domain-containing protein n=1 Tax=Heracleum sosnowskyi TaxID=360622 RepID=A0AAD8HK29_9APIA|nr:hypothetical protein POM88_033602 [Heracleum sosnowskyi]
MAPTGRGGPRNTHRRNNPTSPSPIATSTPLPPALIIKILTHIDPKSLARLRCVSKSWYALITHPLFIKKHLHINTLSINTHVICNAYNTRYRNTRDFIRDSDSNRNCNKVVSLVRLDKMPVRLVELENGVIKGSCDFSKGISFGEFSKNMVLAGSVNGVVLVMNLGELNERFVGLWNPGINRWKVVKIGRERGCGDDRTCSAYGLGGCWEDVDGEFSFWPSQCHCQFIVKGVLYFVGDDVMPDDPRSNQQNYILAGIDPCTGLYKKVHYPEHFRGDTWVKPFEYQNSVAAIVQCTPGALEEHKIDMYVLDDDDTSWIKMYSIGPFPYLEFHQPQQSFKTGLISYSHSESLVTIEGMELIKKKDKNKKTKPKKVNRTELLSKDFESALHL